MECSICFSSFTGQLRKRIECKFCKKDFCRECFRQYILSSFNDADCMHCKMPFDREFLTEHLTKSFVTGDYRRHREQILFDREKSLLPATVTYVEIKKKIGTKGNELETASEELRKMKSSDDYLAYYNLKKKRDDDLWAVHKSLYRTMKDREKENKQIQAKIEAVRYRFDKEVKPKYKEFRAKVRSLEKSVKIRSKELALYRRALNSDNPDEILQGAAPQTERRKFIRACPADGCKGFLSQQWNCGICDCWVCPECHEIKAGGQEDSAHTCLNENVETAKLLAKDTRPCPNCAAQIYKILGCDQMFCTACNTPFSWSKGTVISGGHIHNPHYFEYMKSKGTVHDRTPGDIPCGDVPTQDVFWSHFHKFTAAEKRDFDEVLTIYRILLHIRHVVIIDLPTQNYIPSDTRNYRIQYLMNEKTEIQFKQAIQRAEKRRERGLAIRLIYEMFITACCDILRGVLEKETRKLKPASEWLAEFEGLREYTNECLKKIAKLYNSQVDIIENPLVKGVKVWNLANYKPS